MERQTELCPSLAPPPPHSHPSLSILSSGAASGGEEGKGLLMLLLVAPAPCCTMVEIQFPINLMGPPPSAWAVAPVICDSVVLCQWVGLQLATGLRSP